MTAALIVAVVLLVGAVVWLGVLQLRGRERAVTPVPASGARRILFPFTAQALAPHALDVALRLAGTEDATLVPVFLARVALRLPLETPLPHQSAVAIPLQEAIEQRAASFGIPVDSRIERGRTYRHALRQTIGHERFDRIVVAAGHNGSPGLGTEDIAWLLENAPGEIVVLRPNVNGHGVG